MSRNLLTTELFSSWHIKILILVGKKQKIEQSSTNINFLIAKHAQNCSLTLMFDLC